MNSIINKLNYTEKWICTGLNNEDSFIIVISKGRLMQN